MLHVTQDGRASANELLDIDIKCFENPWPPEMWGKIAGHDVQYGTVVARFFGTPIGFAVYEHDNDESAISLLKWCIKPQHRNKGASLSLLSTVFNYARSKSFKSVYTIVRESRVYPGELNISKYLLHVGFVPTKPFLRNHFVVYGEPENGVKFVAPASLSIREPV